MSQQRVTDAEFAVLRCLWEFGTCNKRQLVKALYPAQTDSDYATVQKLLQRLEKKELVTRDRSGSAHQFSAVLDRDEFARDQMNEVAERVTGGSLAPFVLHLIEGKHLSKQERNQIRQVLDEVDSPSRRKQR